MDSIILHHYPPSSFLREGQSASGVFRPTLAVGHHSAHDASPHLDAVMLGAIGPLQVGADIFCDTEIICRTPNDFSDKTDIYGPVQCAERVARWADTELFKITVALNFRPEAIAGR